MDTNVTLLVLLVIGLGALLALLAWWARIVNRRHAIGGEPFLFKNFWVELRGGRVRQAARTYFFGNVDDSMASAGKLLALAVVVIVSIALLLVVGAVIRAAG